MKRGLHYVSWTSSKNFIVGEKAHLSFVLRCLLLAILHRCASGTKLKWIEQNNCVSRLSPQGAFLIQHLLCVFLFIK